MADGIPHAPWQGRGPQLVARPYVVGVTRPELRAAGRNDRERREPGKKESFGSSRAERDGMRVGEHGASRSRGHHQQPVEVRAALLDVDAAGFLRDREAAVERQRRPRSSCRRISGGFTQRPAESTARRRGVEIDGLGVADHGTFGLPV